MDKDVFTAEQARLAETMAFLKGELARETSILTGKRENLRELNKYMWTEYVSHNLDEDKLKDITQLFTEYHQATLAADNATKTAAKYTRLLDSPYFARVDLAEEGFEGIEEIYIGFHNLLDMKAGRVYIYDWRSPIASVFYRFETGRCYYDSPDGRINGDVTLKRQIKIEKAELKYYADSGLVIRDDILLEVLSQSAPGKMRTIVETIQKEQDAVIRDMANDVLIVSGSAGSGKTSIALHRIAYLLYESRAARSGVAPRGSAPLPALSANNILVLSPSGAFGDYIDEVLPSLGEEKTPQATMDDIYAKILKGVEIQSKYNYLESLMRKNDGGKQYAAERAMAFKTSRLFAELLSRYAKLYERRLHTFQDVVIEGKTLYAASELKAMFLDNKAKLPASVRLERLFQRVTREAEPHFENIRKRLSEIIYGGERHAFEEERRIDALIGHIKKRFYRSQRKQFSINVKAMYLAFLRDEAMFGKLSEGLTIPGDAQKLMARGRRFLPSGRLPYDDAGAFLYLTLLVSGAKDYTELRHVIVDEAQDYGVISFLSLKRLFPNAKVTILGDRNQTIGRRNGPDFFGRVSAFMKNPRTATLTLTKSYRSSLEIFDFCQGILGDEEAEAFCRNGEPPKVIIGDRETLLASVLASVQAQAAGTTAILTKTSAEAVRVYNELNLPIGKKTLLTERNDKLAHAVNIMPIYMAKGLEFDVVHVWGADKDSFKTPLDRNILYVACSRALHRLFIYSSGDVSGFIPQGSNE